MSNTTSVEPSIIKQWVAAGIGIDKLREDLTKLGWDIDIIELHLKEFRKAKFAGRRTVGFICLAIGAFLGFISCVLTILNPAPELYNWILYGLTSLAILIIMAGLYFLFE